MDFNNELLNKYNINEEATIINLEGYIKIKSKRFNGININDYEIEVRNEGIFLKDNLEKFYTKDLFESFLYTKDSFTNIRKSIEACDVSIKDIYGMNGKIVTS